jgi:hypothetical protein
MPDAGAANLKSGEIPFGFVIGIDSQLAPGL